MDVFSEHSCEEIFPEFLHPDRDQAFIDYLNELVELIANDELAEWSDNIDLFMEGFSNPD